MRLNNVKNWKVFLVLLAMSIAAAGCQDSNTENVDGDVTADGDEAMDGDDVVEAEETTEDVDTVDGDDIVEAEETTEDADTVDGDDIVETEETTEDVDTVDGDDIVETEETTEDVDTVDGDDIAETEETTEDVDTVDGDEIAETEETVEDDIVVPEDHSQLSMLAGPFDNPMAVTAQCLTCHPQAGEDMKATHHWNWKGQAPGMTNQTGEHGKVDTINNFCIALVSNEGRCTMCHAGYNWKAPTDYSDFEAHDFDDTANMDCLICHDSTGTYKKNTTTAGLPTAEVDLAVVAQSVGAAPSRSNCGACHFYAGGGDNVKKGDLASSLVDPTPEMDVHMGNGMLCQQCHTTEDHAIMGSGMHSVPTEGSVGCTDCHDAAPHSSATYNTHAAKVSCQTCHIPAFSRALPTKTEWYWENAGTPNDEYTECSPFVFGEGDDAITRACYDQKKGEFVWEMNVKPTYAWYNGDYERMLVGDTFTEAGTVEDPIMLVKPLGDKNDATAKIHPFKVMKGTQPVDASAENRVVLVPHLFGAGGQGGANPYWGNWNWVLALEDGETAVKANPYFDGSGYSFSGAYEWGHTEMYMRINHEVAPKADALTCSDCHFGGSALDWTALGYDGDPASAK